MRHPARLFLEAPHFFAEPFLVKPLPSRFQRDRVAGEAGYTGCPEHEEGTEQGNDTGLP